MNIISVTQCLRPTCLSEPDVEVVLEQARRRRLVVVVALASRQAAVAAVAGAVEAARPEAVDRTTVPHPGIAAAVAAVTERQEDEEEAEAAVGR